MKFDRVSVISVIIFLLFVLSYDRFLKRKYPHLNQQQDIPTASPATPHTPTTITPTTKPQVPPSQEADVVLSPQELTFENRDVLWEVDPRGGGFSKVLLKEYYLDPEEGERQDNLVNLVDDRLWLQPLLGQETLGDKPYRVDISDSEVTFSRSVGGIAITHSLLFPPAGFSVIWKIKIHSNAPSSTALNLFLAMADVMAPLPAKKGLLLPGMPLSRPSLVALTDSSQERFDAEKTCDKQGTDLITKSPLSLVEVLGFDRYHFVTAMVSGGEMRGYYSIHGTELRYSGHCQFSIFLGQNFGSLAPGQTLELSQTLFFGPKDSRITKAIHPKLKETIDLGWFAFLAHPLLYVLHFFYDLTGNYGLAIILLTILLKVLFFPLTRSAAISMNKTRIYQPQLKALRQKYSGDVARQQRETMAFMSKHNINPMRGCLPILPQMPVFLALYRVLSTAVELRHAPFIGWLTDLSSPDPFLITPALLAGGMFLQQKLTPHVGGDELQRKIMVWMPVVFAIMMVGFPSGMVLYMLVNTVVSMAQQLYFNAAFKSA